MLRWFLNSLLAASLQSLLIVATASLAAYALARLDFPGKRVVLLLILATLFVPPVTLLIPNYLIVGQLGWLDSLAAIVVPGAAGAFGVFFLRQFFISLPEELEEAAALDGANRFEIFWKVILPLSRPALVTLAMLSFLTNWNDFLWPVFTLFSPENQTLSAGLSTLQNANAVRYDLLMAGAVIASVPVLILFIAVAALRRRGRLARRRQGLSPPARPAARSCRGHWSRHDLAADAPPRRTAPPPTTRTRRSGSRCRCPPPAPRRRWPAWSPGPTRTRCSS